ncbi:MAG: ATP-grasp domain-containing protein [Clostridiales bacterium]|nr:ATP-grasp domain-containing protein [Clostridiales bacterium]
MSGILIYSEFEAQRNKFAIEKFKSNLDIKLITEDKINFSKSPDYVINRTNNAETARRFESKGIRVFNPYSLSLIANNKQKCYEFMIKNGIEIMPINQTEPPVIEKPSNGKGGKNVSFISENGFKIKKGYVYQKPASDLGKDLRVWLIGGKIITAVLRTNKNDFRSNFCLGGEAQPYFLSQAERETVFKISSLLNYDYIGIDFVFNHGKAVFNEIEDSVGARTVYEKTDIDIIKLYCNYIKSQINK